MITKQLKKFSTADSANQALEDCTIVDASGTLDGGLLLLVVTGRGMGERVARFSTAEELLGKPDIGPADKVVTTGKTTVWVIYERKDQPLAMAKDAKADEKALLAAKEAQP